ncbi:MAG: hypothetical protein KY433_07915 [Actinobacteria bacterium]|nr:hypothetical protein [Actinomycetota bacterium]
MPPLIVLAVAAVAPLVADTPYTHGLLILAVVYALNVLAMHLIFGLTGILSLAQAAFWGIGAYTAAILTVDHGAPFLVGFVAGSALTLLIGDAKARGRRTLLTFGGLATNHGLATALYARDHGLECVLALVDQPVDEHVERQLDRLPPAERALLEVMADLPAEERTATRIAREMGYDKASQIGPTAQRLDTVRGPLAARLAPDQRRAVLITWNSGGMCEPVPAARALGIPNAIDAACAVVARGRERCLDIGDVGGRSFVGIASLGFDSDANRFANAAPARLGRLVYVYGALRALAAWKPARFDLRLDGEPLSCVGYSVAACNSCCYGGGIRLAPSAALDDGLLDVVLIAGHPKRSFLATLPRAFRGTHVRHPAVRVLRGRELQVDADRPFAVYADGEPIGATPATIRVVPRALRVLVSQ